MGGGGPNDKSYPTEAWCGLEGNPVLPSCYPSESLVWGSMVSGRKSACAAAGAQSNIASERAGLSGECL
ncbi:hypothetical protein Hanom_Chr05g00388281 [Helianthus anomalus]